MARQIPIAGSYHDVLAVFIADKLFDKVYKLEFRGIIKQGITHSHCILSEAIGFAEVEIILFSL